MRPLWSFLFGVLLTTSTVLITERTTDLFGRPSVRLVSDGSTELALNGVGRSPTEIEVIETMKTNRMINTLALLSVLGFSGGALAQTVSDDISKIVESVVIDNLKTVAGSGATGLAVSSQGQANAQSILFNNSVSHAARINAITERALAQTMIVGATEGAQGIKTVNEAGTTRDIGQMLGLLNALIAGQKQNAQVVAIPTTP